MTILFHSMNASILHLRQAWCSKHATAILTSRGSCRFKAPVINGVSLVLPTTVPFGRYTFRLAPWNQNDDNKTARYEKESCKSIWKMYQPPLPSLSKVCFAVLHEVPLHLSQLYKIYRICPSVECVEKVIVFRVIHCRRLFSYAALG